MGAPTHELPSRFSGVLACEDGRALCIDRRPLRASVLSAAGVAFRVPSPKAGVAAATVDLRAEWRHDTRELVVDLGHPVQLVLRYWNGSTDSAAGISDPLSEIEVIPSVQMGLYTASDADTSPVPWTLPLQIFRFATPEHAGRINDALIRIRKRTGSKR